MTEIRTVGPEDEAAYSAFLRATPSALLYHSLPYRDLLAGHLNARPEYLIAIGDAGAIRGALPMMWLETGGRRILNSLPYYGSNGGVLSTDADSYGALLAAWNERATDHATAAATLVENPFLEGPELTPVHSLTDERINQATPLPPTGAQVLAAVDSAARRNARKALGVGTEVARDPDALDRVYEIHVQNMADIGGRPKRRSFFDAIPSLFRPHDEFDVYTATQDGVITAALLVFWFGTVAEYFTPVVDHDHRGDQPLAAILAESLADAADRGISWWNWGGTWDSQVGVYRFKRKWGARDRRYRYFIQVNDRSLLQATAAELRETFGDFYIVPFSALATEEIA